MSSICRSSGGRITPRSFSTSMDSARVLHLHGHSDEPKSVILGTKSYDRQVTDERRNFLQGLASLTRPTLFVGCSAQGLNDPDFSGLRDWLGGWEDWLQRRYRLVSRGADLRPDLRSGLFPIDYGAHAELSKFLRELAPGKAPPSPPLPPPEPESAASITSGRSRGIRPRGRDREVARALIAGRPAVVAGRPAWARRRSPSRPCTTPTSRPASAAGGSSPPSRMPPSRAPSWRSSRFLKPSGVRRRGVAAAGDRERLRRRAGGGDPRQRRDGARCRPASRAAHPAPPRAGAEPVARRHDAGRPGAASRGRRGSRRSRAAAARRRRSAFLAVAGRSSRTTLSSTRCSNRPSKATPSRSRSSRRKRSACPRSPACRSAGTRSAAPILKQEGAKESRLTSVSRVARPLARKARAWPRIRSRGDWWHCSPTCPPAWQRAT